MTYKSPNEKLAILNEKFDQPPLFYELSMLKVLPTKTKVQGVK